MKKVFIALILMHLSTSVLAEISIGTQVLSDEKEIFAGYKSKNYQLETNLIRDDKKTERLEMTLRYRPEFEDNEVLMIYPLAGLGRVSVNENYAFAGLGTELLLFDPTISLFIEHRTIDSSFYRNRFNSKTEASLTLEKTIMSNTTIFIEGKFNGKESRKGIGIKHRF